MSTEITESAKAVQEVAKAANTGIVAGQQLGSFVARLIGEPLEVASGMVTDRLRFARAERLLRLNNRWKEVLTERGITKKLRIVSPKLVLPILEHASLEDDDELQDLWANLLASAVDPDFDGSIRSAFVDVIRQLEVVDVHILHFMYRNFEELQRNTSESGVYSWSRNPDGPSPTDFGVNGLGIAQELHIDRRVYENSADNLMRLRCIASFIETKMIQEGGGPKLLPMYENVSLDHMYDQVCMTAFGVSFVEGCLGSRKFGPVHADLQGS